MYSCSVVGAWIRYADVAQGKEIWITEIGTQDLNSQGEFPQRAFDAIVGTGVCKHVLWFCWYAHFAHCCLLAWLRMESKIRTFRVGAMLSHIYIFICDCFALGCD